MTSNAQQPPLTPEQQSLLLALDAHAPVSGTCKTSEYMAATRRRNEIALKSLELVKQGLRGHKLRKRVRQECGISIFEIITIATTIWRIVSFVVKWWEGRKSNLPLGTASVLLALLLCLPVHAEPLDIELKVNGDVWAPLSPIPDLADPASEKNSAAIQAMRAELDQQRKQVEWLTRLAELGPIYTAMMPGETFTERWRQATEKIITHKGEKTIIVEAHKWLRADVPMSVFPGARSISGVTIESAGLSTIFWGSEIPDHYEHAMLTIPARWNLEISGGR